MKQQPTTGSINGLTLLLLLSPSLSASAITLIYDDFEGGRESPYAINGSTANTGQTWVASPALAGGVSTFAPFNPTDSLLKPDPTIDGSGYITGITLVPNCEYILSLDAYVGLDGGTNTSDWLGLGFRTTSFANLTSGTVGSMLHRVDPEVQTFSANSANSQTIAVSAWNTGMSAELKNLSVILTTGSSLADSSVRWEIDGNAIGLPQATNASNVDGVFFQFREDAGGYIDNFTLTHEAIPEPSSSLLLGLGCLTLIARRKRT